jgi:dienelactone hydrolase
MHDYNKYREDQDVTKPVLMLHGTADDFVSVAQCREYAERLSKAGKSVRIIEYPDAHHLFDLPAFRQVIRNEQGVSFRRCRLEEGDNGLILNSETKQPFSPSNPCLEKGVTIAYQEAAANKSHEDVKAFLKDAFQLN